MSEEAGMSSHLLIKPEDSDRVPAVWRRRSVVFRCLGATALETVNGIRRVTRLSPFIFRLCAFYSVAQPDLDHPHAPCVRVFW